MNGLFKYFPVDLYKVEKLAHHQILLTPPKYFNDPWDFLVRREPITDDEIRMIFAKFQNERPSNVNSDEFKTSITRAEFVEQEGPDMLNALSNIVGVVVRGLPLLADGAAFLHLSDVVGRKGDLT